MADPKAMIPVVDPETGKTGYIDPKFAPDAARTGLRGASDREIRGAQVKANAEATRADLDKEYDGTIEGAVAPALAGAARGLTLGGSDVALAELGPGMRQRLLDYQEYAPNASAVGEFGAIAASALVGEEGALGRLPGLVGKLGRGAEGLAARELGEGLAGRIASKALGGGVEGAIYAEGKASGDAALHNENLTTEKIISAGIHGAGFGAILGGGLGLAGAGAERVAGGFRRTAEEEAGAIGGLRPPRGYQAEEGSLRESIGEKIQKTADVKTIKAMGGSAADLRALEKNVPGGFRKVAQDIQGDIEGSTGKSIGFHNKESLHEYATARVEELGDKLGGMLKKLDDAGSGVAPDIKSFASKVREELIAPNTVRLPTGESVVKPGQSSVVNATEKWLAEVEGAYGHKAPTFTEWQQSRRALDQQINYAARQASPEMGALKQIRGMMEGELEKSGEAAAKLMGTSFQDEYQATKSLYQSVRKAQELTERGVSRELVNNSMGLGATMGSLTGLATGGPVASVAMGLAGKLVKDRGDQMAADLLGRAADILGVSRVAARISARMERGVTSLVGGKVEAGAMAAPKAGSGGFLTNLLSDAGTGAKRTATAAGATRSAEFARHADAVNTLQGNPAALTARIGQALGPLTHAAPKVAAAATTLVLGDLKYIADKLPPSRQDPFTLQPQFQPTSRASDTEISRHMRIVEALDNPTIILDHAKAGTLTRDEVDAVRDRRPLMYAEMQQQVMRSLVDSKTELPYGRRIQLGILLDIPTDKTLSPDFQTAIQATYSDAEKAGAESPPQPPAHPQQLASGLQTGVESAMAGGSE